MKLYLYLSIILSLFFSANLFAEYDPWPAIKQDLFDSRNINKDQQFISLYIPETVEDAALVPVKIRLAANVVSTSRKIYLIIDRNPDPYAMQIDFMPAYNTFDIGERLITTRIRLNEFSNVRAILETSNGDLYMSEIFATGSGGCSAPTTDFKQALTDMGQIRLKLRHNENIHKDWSEATIMIRHPNFTGMQLDTSQENAFIPAKFIQKIEVLHEEELLLTIQSGISIAENPVFRFNFGSDDKQNIIKVRAVDNENNNFTNELSKSYE